jgi:hypothetical protein
MCRVNPRQLAPTVGTLGVGIMNSTAFSPLANSNPEVDEIQIPFGTIDFQPHQSSFTQVFESMDQDMDLMIESLNFRVGSLGLIHLSDPVKPGPSASKSKKKEKSQEATKPWRILTWKSNSKIS